MPYRNIKVNQIWCLQLVAEMWCLHMQSSKQGNQWKKDTGKMLGIFRHVKSFHPFVGMGGGSQIRLEGRSNT
jgi:hypothetical protein